jgi:hypothetical protein
MSKLIQIKTSSTAILTKLQKQFNSSIQKINQLKNELQTVNGEIDIIKIKISSDIIPLEKKLIDVQIQEVKYLDQIYQENRFKKRDNQTLSEIILERTYGLIGQFGVEELEELFTRHNNGKSFEEADRETEEMASEAMKETFSGVFGIEFEEGADVSTPEKMQAYIAEKMEQEQAQKEADKANKKKTAKQIEREEKQRQEEKNLNKTSRQIYMELVKEFHPDREKDDLEKERKTLLMHKITESYEKDDLFELLRLRLELLGTDFEHSNDEQLKYYVKLLKQQILELEEQMEGLKMFGKTSFFGLSLYDRFASDPFMSLDKKFKKEVNHLKKVLKNAETQLPLYAQTIQVKQLIDEFRHEQKYQKNNKFDFSDAFGMGGR